MLLSKPLPTNSNRAPQSPLRVCMALKHKIKVRQLPQRIRQLRMIIPQRLLLGPDLPFQLHNIARIHFPETPSKPPCNAVSVLPFYP